MARCFRRGRWIVTRYSSYGGSDTLKVKEVGV